MFPWLIWLCMAGTAKGTVPSPLPSSAYICFTRTSHFHWYYGAIRLPTRKEFAKTCSDIIFDIYMRSNDVRRFGSAAIELCMVAFGKIELFFEMRLQPWDYAAASLILSEAGGVSCGFDGGPLSLSNPSLTLAANNQDNLSELLSTVHRYLPELPY